MRHRIVILGGGTGGTLVANRLQRLYGDDAHIVVVDRDDHHVYQPGLLFVPFGLAEPADLVRPRHRQLHHAIEWHETAIERVETARNTVILTDDTELFYDVLVVATGAELLPEETEGLADAGDRVHTFYSLDGAIALRDRLQSFREGRLVVSIVDMPIKCPVAPLEFCFLADWWLQTQGCRDAVELSFVTPLDGAFTRPLAAERLGSLLRERRIELVPEFATGRIDGAAGELVSWDERTVPFDLLVTVPLHGGAAYVGRSPGLGDELGFVPTDPHTLQAKVAPDVFALGDATNLPTSKAGSVTHFEGETLVENVARFLADEPLEGSYDGHANCFVETGFHRALLIDFNYEVEPAPGRFPLAHLGPLPLLAESRLNHLAKLMFQSVYWHVLLPGHDMPGIHAQLQAAAKGGAS